MARRHEVFITDEQWEQIKPFLPQRKRSPKGGRPPADDRACLEGILWVLRSGARWRDLPERYPSPSTCWRRLVEWEGEDVLLRIWHAFLDALDEQGLLDWEEVFVDASFSPAKKGASESGKPSEARVQSGWWWQMAGEFHWHAGPKVLRLQRSRWSKKSSKRSRGGKSRRP
jgi:transposase